MMQEPTLVIMAAGMGSRFGGLKQITSVDDFGHAIIDFSLYDARRAGFKKIAFIIKHEIEESFMAAVGSRMEKYFQVKYVFQQLDKLPEGYEVPEGREKPWGTGHAVLCCKDAVDGPFAVINADDFYGKGAYEAIYNFLKEDRPLSEYAMVAYRLRNTVTENGHVSRGVCEVENGYLKDITERTHIEKRGEDAAFTEDGVSFEPLSGDTPVSMNFWGFSRQMLNELEARFPAFLDKGLAENPKKCEYFLPFVADEQLKEGIATVRVLDCDETWYGMTYREDLDSVKAAIAKMKSEGIYPEKLWE
ncbi:MAG: sugar phosphate nucleotidyltransferase [Bacillota bacterium]|nr:sugar phosphate nucleotidyltransferase [Bacillota bacterium]